MPRGLLRRAPAAFLLLLLAAGASARVNDIPSKPLPDARAFLEAVRDSLRSDQTLLSEYTFLEKHVETKLDGRGVVKSSKTELFEVYPSSKPGRLYRRLVMVDDKPVDPRQLAEEDRKHEEKVEKRRLERENETADQKRRRHEKE
ncbi:MAG: hypothetical protein ACRD3M_14630, partial [Thermoanaerobaculia bacterium]